MSDPKPKLGTHIAKLARIALLLAIALLLFYVGVNFRVIEIPDFYVELHPWVLPGQHWVIKRGDAVPAVGDLVMYALEEPGGPARRRISLLVGYPGQKVEFLPEDGQFKVDGTPLEHEFELNRQWTEATQAVLTLNRNEYLLIDNNPLADGQRFWQVERSQVAGKLLFQLPF